MLLMEETTEKYLKLTLDDGVDNKSSSIPITLEGDSEHGYCIDQTTLEHNLRARHAI